MTGMHVPATVVALAPKLFTKIDTEIERIISARIKAEDEWFAYGEQVTKLADAWERDAQQALVSEKPPPPRPSPSGAPFYERAPFDRAIDEQERRKAGVVVVHSAALLAELHVRRRKIAAEIEAAELQLRTLREGYASVDPGGSAERYLASLALPVEVVDDKALAIRARGHAMQVSYDQLTSAANRTTRRGRR